MEKREYKPGDIVFVKWKPRKEPSGSWPCVNSAYEIDCKILRMRKDKLTATAEVNVYVLISGNGVSFTAMEEDLIHPKDRYLFMEVVVYQAEIDTELFPKDTKFIQQDTYMCNEDYGVYISEQRFEELLEKGVFKLLKN